MVSSQCSLAVGTIGWALEQIGGIAALYVVEVKRRERIGEEVVGEVREKIRKIRIKRGMSVFPILVYDGVLSKRVPSDGFFSSVVSSEQLLGIA